ncbi:MAG: hypothetical protein ACT4NT_03185 [Nitrososphaerota archaeon]
MSKLDKKSSEFEDLGRLDLDALTIQTLEFSKFKSEGEIKQILEKKITDAVIPIATSLIGSLEKLESTRKIDRLLQSITSKIPSAQMSHYFRAGKHYFTINHKMGYAGNILFKSIFDNFLKERQDNAYLITQENSICVICRV